MRSADGTRIGGSGDAQPASTAASRRGRHRNICCVGDDDQSIYGWRGAEVDNILRFEKDFPGARSSAWSATTARTGHILAAASHLIAHNEGRLGKTLRTEDEPGEKVHRHFVLGLGGGSARVGEEIEQLQRNDGTGKPHPLDEIAILVRASFQMREFEDRFVTLGLPYRVIGGPRFYERQEIRDALAYLRVVHRRPTTWLSSASSTCPSAGSATPPSSSCTITRRRKRVPLTEAAPRVIATDELKPKPRAALRDLLGSIDRWRGSARRPAPYRARRGS